MATPEQTQAILQQLGQSNPEFAATPPAFQQQFVAALANAGSPRAQAQQIAALQQQYPQYIKTQSVWKNPAFIAGLAALTAGVASAAIPALVGGGAGGTAAAVGGGVAAAANPFAKLFSKDVLPYIIGGAASVGGAAIAAQFPPLFCDRNL